MTNVTSREFNHDVGRAKRAAADGPVVITDRGEPAYVLMSFEEYERLRGAEPDIVDLLSADDDLDIEFAPVHVELKVPDL